MSKGKFEAGRKKPVPAKKEPFATEDNNKGGKLKGKLWPILAAVAGVAVIAVGVLLITGKAGSILPGGPDATETTEVRGLSREELEAEALKVDTTLRRNNLVLTLAQELEPGQQTEEPILVTVTPRVSGAGLNLEQLRADLEAEKGKVGKDKYELKLEDYLQLDRDALRKQADEIVEQYGSEFVETLVDRGDRVPAEDPGTEASSEPTEPSETPEATQPDESAETTEAKEEKPQTKGGKRSVYIRKGVTGRTFNADEIYNALLDAYSAVFGETGAEEQAPAAKPLAPELTYTLQKPQPIDVEAIYDEFCTEPKDAVMDEKTFEISDEKNGYSFNKEKVLAQVEALGEGEELLIKLKKVKPKVTAEELRATLFRDVLAEAHTVHSAIPDRTNNLILACKAIDGTIILPGQTFSFNGVVGERTPEKGYKPAIAYVSGGASKPETGGGVCQVASSIYYAVLQADLKTVERAPHMYLVDYVPGGMDAAIYWGQLDYKFENNSPYPIRIDASVSNGK
ncbi:MAG: VanW family protein, partial [Oscillospiraceae bacterium]|nr:VanW family protein [Oscillospiraceae bacterium]